MNKAQCYTDFQQNILYLLSRPFVCACALLCFVVILMPFVILIFLNPEHVNQTLVADMHVSCPTVTLTFRQVNVGHVTQSLYQGRLGISLFYRN